MFRYVLALSWNKKIEYSLDINWNLLTVSEIINNNTISKQFKLRGFSYILIKYSRLSRNGKTTDSSSQDNRVYDDIYNCLRDNNSVLDKQ